MTDNQALTPLQRRWSLAAVISSAFAFGLTFGLSGPMIALILEENGVSSTFIGLNSAVASLAVLVIGPVIPRILDRLGPLPTMYLSVAGSVLMLLLFPWWTSVPLWFVLRFLLGGFGALHWIVSEIWIVSIVDKANRGKVVGLYVTVVSAGFAVGPLLINLVGVEGWLPFLLAAALISSSALPLVLARHSGPTLPVREAAVLKRAFVLAPVIFLAASLAGLTDTTLLTLLHIYGLRSGFDQQTAVIMLTVAFTGTVALQVPVGWIADHLDHHLLLVLFGFLFVGIPLAVPFILNLGLVFWPVLFIWGGASMGIYTVGLTMLGERFELTQLAGANAVFVMIYEIGSLIGPVLAGAGMDLVGRNGFLIALAAPAAIFIAFAALQRNSWRN